MAESPTATAVGISISSLGGKFILGMSENAMPFRFDTNTLLPAFEPPLSPGVLVKEYSSAQ
jgi:hypothetical protein